jgi:hypothetical protein
MAKSPTRPLPWRSCSVGRTQSIACHIWSGEIASTAQETYAAWLSLYAAVGTLALMTAMLATIKTALDYGSGSRDLPFRTWQDRSPAAPSLWLRWQVNYLLGSPTILGVAVLYAHRLG